MNRSSKPTSQVAICQSARSSVCSKDLQHDVAGGVLGHLEGLGVDHQQDQRTLGVGADPVPVSVDVGTVGVLGTVDLVQDTAEHRRGALTLQRVQWSRGLTAPPQTRRTWPAAVSTSRSRRTVCEDTLNSPTSWEISTACRSSSSWQIIRRRWLANIRAS
jgi:hypothetical protein